MEIKGKVHCFFEQWKDIEGYKGIYQVSNLGRVRSLDHYVKTGHNGERLVKGRILKQNKTCNGYLFIKTSKKYGSKHLAVHRLVAKAFIENSNKFPNVNHKDEIKHNNIVTNLEWCNHSYNALYGTCQERLNQYKQKSVEALDKNTKEVVYVFKSMKYAAETLGIYKEQISSVCRGERKTAGGYIWRYKQ